MTSSPNAGKEYWNHRVAQFGHTGWSNPLLYRYDQRARVVRIRELVRLDQNSTILDFGCGTGELAEALALRSPKSMIVGIDVSDKVIEVARERLRGFGNIVLMAEEIDSGSLSTGAFDLILCITVLQHLDTNRIPTAFKRFAELLRPAGRIVLLENVYRSQQSSGYINKGFSESSWRELAEAAGFRIDCTTSYPHWGALAVETVLPMLRSLREKLHKPAAPASSDAKRSPAPAAAGGIAALLVKLLLAATWPLDHLLRLPLPRRWRHYAVFVMTKG